MILRWFSEKQAPDTNPLPPDTGYHGGDRSLSALWMVFHPDVRPVPVPVPDTGVRYCRNSSHWCAREDRSSCSTARTGPFSQSGGH